MSTADRPPTTLGARPGTFENWARTWSCSPQAQLRPRDREELSAIITRAAAEGVPLKAPGAGHSWSEVAATAGWHLQLADWQEETPIRVDPVAGRVRLGPGVRLFQLNSALAAAGMALPSLGSISDQNVVGALATGTHGTGLRSPILGAGLQALELIDGQGKFWRISGEEHAELLPAARLHLGALGVVTALEMACVPAFHLEERLEHWSWERLAVDLPAALAHHDHLKVWWLPYTDVVQVYTMDRTDSPPTGPGSLQVRLDRWGVSAKVMGLLLAIQSQFPGLIPLHHRMLIPLGFAPRRRVEPSPLVFNIPMQAPRHDESEAAFPIEVMPEALAELRRRIDAASQRPRALGGYHVDFIVELRFSAGDGIHMSPCFGGPRAWIGAYAADPANARPYLADFAEVVAQFGGRPHWGKVIGLPPSLLSARYPGWLAFQDARNRLDPAGILRNRFTETYLDPEIVP